MLIHYLLNKLSIMQYLTATFFVLVFFIPQNIYSASYDEAISRNSNFPTIYILFFIAILAAVLICYYLLIMRSKKKKPVEISDIIRNMFLSASQSIEESIIVIDTAMKIIYINPKAEEFLGFNKEEALGMELSWFYDDSSLFAINQLTKEYDNKTQNYISSKIKTKTGIWIDIVNIVIPVKNSYFGEMGTIIFLQSHKILEEAAATIESSCLNILHADSNKDNIEKLTELPNRKLLSEYLDNAIKNEPSENSKYALMLVNLDFFRSINNNLGYEVGDIILKECAERLKTLYTDCSFLARMDSDEFALIVAISDINDIEAAANKVFSIMREPIIISGQKIYISVSIGIAYFPEQGKSSCEIIRNAATAVNMAKTTRRGGYKVFSSDISKYSLQKFNIHSELHLALERKEFILHYQPKISGKTGQIVSIEALIRWNHPEKGLLYPIDFIPIAEETGIIKYIDEWVLHTACNQLMAWTAEGMDNIRLSVNLSAWQFKDHHLVDIISKILAETGINPNMLELEITETTAIENINFTQNILNKLINKGIMISIDDFGTGYSSLNYLKNFPINFIKIDKSFMTDIIKDSNTYSIVKAIIEVAHALKLRVIAEGVENQDQLNLLNSLGCDEIQGFLISKPLALEDVKKALILENLPSPKSDANSLPEFKASDS